MRTNTIVARVLNDCKAFMHAMRWQRLVDVSTAALNGQPLALTQLALGSHAHTSVRHRVKAVDRLLGNAHIAAAHLALYRSLAAQWLEGVSPLLIVVDWSSLSADMHWHWLRASVVVQGRSLTLYEEVHPRRHLAALSVHKRFVQRLACVLPAQPCPPIILTDAGFRGTWFALVKAQGWHWVGRLRNREFVSPVSDPQEEVADAKSACWFAAKALYAAAQAKSEDLGLFDSTRSRPNRCRLVRVKRLPQARKRRYASGQVHRNAYSLKQAAGAREPWLLSCSPGLAHLSAEAIVSVYAQRMQIEQSFRDTKNERVGLGLSRSRSHGQQRLEALLLIGHIASLAKRLIGEAAKSQQLQLQLLSRKQGSHQAYADISVMTLATRVIACAHLMHKIGNPLVHLHRLRTQALQAITVYLSTSQLDNSWG